MVDKRNTVNLFCKTVNVQEFFYMASIYGSNIKETLNGTINDDYIFGFDGDDILNGGDGNDYLDGGNGNDSLDGGNGNDSLDGGNGNDLLKGGKGVDTLNGGGGFDTADYSQFNFSITLKPEGFLTKGVYNTDKLVGIEKIIADSRVANNTIDASTAVGASITVNLQTQSLAVNGVPGVGPFTIVNFDDVKGTNLNDTITGDSQSNLLFGGLGNDFLFGGGLNGASGNDYLDGGDGNDYLDGGDGNDTLVGGLGNDFLLGGLGNDILSGGGLNGGASGNDYLDGGDGNDFLVSGLGNDSLIGGLGNDTLFGGLGNDTLIGGNGADRFVFNSLSEGIDIITDFNSVQGDKIQVSKVGFGAFSLNQFTYNSITGGLFFQNNQSAAVQFATVQNPINFAISSSIVLV
jgi:Ca2+-binding RTX toxin-like protein